MYIVILGWGSLLWDERPEFNEQVKKWENDGPELPLEFSRVSKTRGDALTLVIDENGSNCIVAHARSERKAPEDAIADLCHREGTSLANIGYCFADGSKKQSRSSTVLSVIAQWAKEKSVDVVVWTDLKSNFTEKSKEKREFSVAAAITHLQSLSPEGKAKAAEYVRRAPTFIKTALRSAIESEPWFQSLG